MKKVSFTRLDQGTTEEHRYARQISVDTWRKILADRVIQQIKMLKEVELAWPVNDYDHSLQTATRCLRDGQDEEMVVCALLHDVGEVAGPHSHGDIAAALLRPYISEANHWMIQNHTVFQGYYFWHHTGRDRNAREKFRGHPHFERTASFCEKWDMPAFDPKYDSMPLEAFEPMIRRIFGREPFAQTGM